MSNLYTLTSSVPTPAGYIIVADAKVLVYKKPRWFHRKMMQICFGWTFEDYKPVPQQLNG
jgi:hypothetical protein